MIAGSAEYDDHRRDMGARNRAQSASGRDIAADFPSVQDPDRRAACEADFCLYCETYHPGTFTRAWSPDHLTVIAKMQRAATQGGLFAQAMPRGSGKTTLAETLCEWSVLTGKRSYVSLIGATAERAEEMLGSIKIELETNDLLLADFPEVCYPIQCLEGMAARAGGQLFKGQRTRLTWTMGKVVLPLIPGSKAAGAVITTSGLDGAGIRGQKHKLGDGTGTVLRPSLVILDDPQTRKSAGSVLQNREREALIAGDVLGMTGKGGKKLSAIMCCTVIRPDDMADHMLNRKLHPYWQGERTKMVYSFPTNEKLWDQYRVMREESFTADGDGREATEFYQWNREEMDAGSEVAWSEDFEEDEISALQHAMNLKFRDEAAFMAECQNDPMPDDSGAEEMLTAEQIAAKTNGIDRWLVPIGCTRLTSFIDCHKKLLYYAVVAWKDDFSGYVIDYGTYPDQKRRYYSLRDSTITLAMKAPESAGMEAALYAGLGALCKQLLDRQWMSDEGSSMRIERDLIDANWGETQPHVYQFCRQDSHAAILRPSHGRGITASSRPLNDPDRQRKVGERTGLNWRESFGRGKAVRHVVFDTNYWKSFIHSRWAVPMGDAGCLSLFGDKASVHRMFGDHQASEFCVMTEGRGRTVNEWRDKLSGGDNHLFDCIVGCAIGASMTGVALPGLAGGVRRKRIKLSELQASKR